MQTSKRPFFSQVSIFSGADGKNGISGVFLQHRGFAPGSEMPLTEEQAVDQGSRGPGMTLRRKQRLEAASAVGGGEGLHE